MMFFSGEKDTLPALTPLKNVPENATIQKKTEQFQITWCQVLKGFQTFSGFLDEQIGNQPPTQLHLFFPLEV